MASYLEAKAKKAFVDGQFKHALDHYSQSIEYALHLNPRTKNLSRRKAELYARRAEVNIELKNLREALADAKEAINLAPGESKIFKMIKECEERIAEETVDLQKQTLEEVTTNVVPAKEVVALPKPTYRHKFRQKREEVVVRILAEGIPHECVSVDFGEQILSVTIKAPDKDAYHFQTRLFGKIIPDKCGYDVLSTKVKIRLAKAEPIQWTSLEFSRVVEEMTGTGKCQAKKRVRFADDVMEPSSNNKEYRKRPKQTKVGDYHDHQEMSDSMPLNRQVLYKRNVVPAKEVVLDKDMPGPVSLALPKPTYRHKFRQNREEVVVRILAEGIPHECVSVDFGEQILSVTIKAPDKDAYHFQTCLFGKIIPDKCRYDVLSTKVRIWLAKAEPIQWTSLDFSRIVAALGAAAVPEELLINWIKAWEIIEHISREGNSTISKKAYEEELTSLNVRAVPVTSMSDITSLSALQNKSVNAIICCDDEDDFLLWYEYAGNCGVKVDYLSKQQVGKLKRQESRTYFSKPLTPEEMKNKMSFDHWRTTKQ